MRLARIALAVALVAGALIVALLVFRERGERPAAPDTAAGEPAATTWYTCGMHPEVIQDHPGNCPKCGMKLVPMSPDRAAALGLSKEVEGTPAGERRIAYWKSQMVPGEIRPQPGKDSTGRDLVPVYADEVAAGGAIRIDPVTTQNMGVRVDEVKLGPLVKTVRTVATVEYDERLQATVTTKVAGWVETLYVSQTGVQVHAGEPLFALYSPELFSAQEEYLAARRNLRQSGAAPLLSRSATDAERLVRDARTRLEFFDISAEQIAELERTGKVRKTLTIRAPFTGIVTNKKVVEGQYVTPGADLFRIADISTVWVIAKVFEQDVPFVRVGQEALMTLPYVPGKTFRGRVTYVYPYLEEGTRAVPVRMEFHNPGYELKPGMYAEITLTTELVSNAVLVPDVAVIDTGRRTVAFVETAPGRFEPRQVTLGPRGGNNYVEVLAGLAPGDVVVVSGQFMLDSEARLREAALKMVEPGKAGGANPIRDLTQAAEGNPTPESEEGQLFYACPMPEHVDILYDHPGKCPLCGMELVPVRRHGAQVEEPRIAYWTCPMPEHSYVHESHPGRCPVCGMTLVPVIEPTPPTLGGTPTPTAAAPTPGAGAP